MFIAGIICIICYEPLGQPDPDASNLALVRSCSKGVLIAGLSFVPCDLNPSRFQRLARLCTDFPLSSNIQSSSKIMASITGMIPQDSLVLRDGHQKSIPASELVVGKHYQSQRS